MKAPLTADNLTSKVTQDAEEIIIEPGYIGFMREHNYPIEEINETHVVKRNTSDTAHLVLNITTTSLPNDHPDLDVVADTIDLWVCDCWSWRQNSADLSEDEPIEMCSGCVHTREVSKVEKAQADESQQSLEQL